ncbi:hypothetical protein HN415_08510 [Candidatus Woesearchaeota archaeon]|nr:hypothetical protein [Candidatus Woesearchaeota archaeon]
MSLFAATYKISGAWFDIGRVDSLFLFLLLIGLFLLKFKNTIWMFILSAIIFSLAFLTKQTALIIFLPTIIYCILVKRRNGFYYIGTFILLIISSTILFNILHNGWYTYYVFNLPSQHPILFDMISHFWITDILLPLSVGFFLSIYYLYFLFTKSIKKINNIISYCNGNENLIFYSLFFLGMVGASFFSRIHQGGYDNVLIPAYAIISILFGLSLHQILNNNKKIQKNIILQTFVLIICILQFCCLFYNPFNQLPTNKDLVAGENLVKELKNIEGEVFIPFHGYLSIIADKKNYAHQMAIYDIIRANDDDIKKELNDEIKNSMQDKKFDAIIIDHPWFFQELIDANYNKKENVFNDNEVFFPKTGAKLRPEYIYKI